MRIINSRKSITWSCKQCESIGNDITSLKSAIVSLQNEIKQLKNTMETVQQPQAQIISNSSFEEIIVEFEERVKRKNNVILYGLPEQPHDVAREARKEFDSNAVKDVMKNLDKTLPTSDIEVIRLGRLGPSSGRPRPVKIIFSKPSHSLALLKMSRDLKKNSKFSHLNITNDWTPRQQEYFRELRSETERRRKNGEDVTIKFFHGIPKIVNASTN